MDSIDELPVPAGHSCVQRVLQASCVVVVIIAGGLGLQGCGSDTDGGSQASIIYGSGSGRVPDEELRDWVSYADAIAVVRVVDERRTGSDAEDRKNGEGLIGRDVVVEVDEVLWRRPTSQELPSTFSFGHTGWLFHGDEEVPMGVDGAARLTVGDTYLMPLVVWAQEGGWSLMTSTSSMEMIDERVTLFEETDRRPSAVALSGHTASEVSAILQATRPQPEAEQNPQLTPEERYCLVVNCVEEPGG